MNFIAVAMPIAVGLAGLVEYFSAYLDVGIAVSNIFDSIKNVLPG